MPSGRGLYPAPPCSGGACADHRRNRAGDRAPDGAPSLSTAMDVEAAARGATIARASCAGCHAIEAAGDSPMAIAPPFRVMVQRRSSDDLAAAFERGLVTTHPAMPPYVFRANEIHDLTAYLDTLRDGVDRRVMP